MIHRCKIKNTWNILTSMSVRIKIDNASANTAFGITINKKYRRGRRYCVKSEKDCRFTSHMG